MSISLLHMRKEVKWAEQKKKKLLLISLPHQRKRERIQSSTTTNQASGWAIKLKITKKIIKLFEQCQYIYTKFKFMLISLTCKGENTSE